MPSRRSTRSVSAEACAAALAFTVAYGVIGHPGRLQLVGGALGLLGIIAVTPVGPAVIAVPGVWLATQRVAGLLSVGDALVLVAALAAVAGGLLAPLPRELRALVASLGVLLGLDAVSVAVNTTQAGVSELVHRVIVVLGAAAVGAWLQRAGKWPVAFRMLLVVTLGVALVACVDAVVKGPPAYPLGYHKNFAGSVFTVVIILLLAAPEGCGVPRGSKVRWLSLACLLGGLFSTASRGAILGLALAVLLWVLRPGSGGRRVPPALGLTLVLLLSYVAFTSIQGQLTDHSVGSEQNSLAQRRDVEQATRDLWRSQPVAGVGLRYFTTPAYASFQAPNNMFDEALAEAGVLGAIGLAYFVGSTVLFSLRMRHPMGQAASMVLVNAFFHGQIDIFWANGQTLTWIVFGVAAGVLPSVTASAQPTATATGSLRLAKDA